MSTNEEINWEQLSLVVGDENDPGDEEMKDLYRLFVDDAGQRLGRLCDSQAGHELIFIAKESHKIRGAAASFGFDRVAEFLRVVESQIETLPRARIEELLVQARAAFDNSVRCVAARFPGLAA
ncbi:hypothetical protein ASA1KI_02880 [Opitutales bacterium ASA1]|jgi:HPt (histidine-containing phosphotransfer) domain-containing protein|uniref:Hpt domain-containing protein n=1 Tax=Congregicoccus parvus TaxID=3081749 RepID=UPI002B2A2620|nr:hypothetical protein ASA1KI_02880 [Opitutales bacterium ASA1]